MDLDSPFWHFSLEVYGRAGVPDACLVVQQRYRVDVNLMLFAAWCGSAHGWIMHPTEVAQAREAVADWHREIVVALRGVRQRLKVGPPPAPTGVTNGLRKEVQRLEIQAEQIEQAALYAWGREHMPPPSPGSMAACAANLVATVTAFAGGSPDDASVEALRVVLGAVYPDSHGSRLAAAIAAA